MLIAKSFKSYAITNALDGTEDEAVWDDEREEAEDPDDALETKSEGEEMKVLCRTTNLQTSVTSNICFMFMLFQRVLESFDRFNHWGNLPNFIFCGVDILGYKMHPEFRTNFD